MIRTPVLTLFTLLFACGDDGSESPKACAPGEAGQPCAPCDLGFYCPGSFDDPELCSDDTWDHDLDPSTPCVSWTNCEPGEWITTFGSPRTDRDCVPCEAESYSSTLNTPRCTPFSVCGYGTFLESPGTPDADNVCTPFTDCVDGELVAEEPGAELDRVCRACLPGEVGAGINAEDCTLSELSEVYAGYLTTCSLRESDGKLICWGQDPKFPEETEFEALVFGWENRCAIRKSDKKVLCWSEDASLPPDEDIPYAQVVVFGEGICGLRNSDRTMTCWALTFNAPALPIVAFKMIDASKGDSNSTPHVCGIRTEDNRLECWGNVFPDTPSGVEFNSVTLGINHGCGLRVNGRVYCWGDDTYGQIADRPDTMFSSIASSANTICGIRLDDDNVVCWGDDSNGEVTGAPDNVPFETFVAGASHFCGVRKDRREVVCWGYDFGQVSGIPSKTKWDQISTSFFGSCGIRSDRKDVQCFGPIDPPSNQRFKKISTSSWLFGCGIREDDLVSCWNTPPTLEPPINVKFDDISLSFAHMCGIRQDEKAPQCWGLDQEGSVHQTPVNVRLDSISAGNKHNCAIKSDDKTLLCWGSNIEGQSTPPEGAFSSVATRGDFACAIRVTDSKVVCWGEGADGQLDAPDIAMESVAPAQSFACGIRSDDKSVLCWGKDSDGVISDIPEGPFRSVSANANVACGIRADDTKTCWGGLVWNPR